MDVGRIGMSETSTAWTAIPMLLAMAALVLVWFPGYNAKRWGHAHWGIVTAFSWTIGGLGMLATFTGWLVSTSPFLIFGWLTVLVWSYGRSANTVKAVSPHSAFGVIIPAVPIKELDEVHVQVHVPENGELASVPAQS